MTVNRAANFVQNILKGLNTGIQLLQVLVLAIKTAVHDPSNKSHVTAKEVEDTLEEPELLQRRRCQRTTRLSKSQCHSLEHATASNGIMWGLVLAYTLMFIAQIQGSNILAAIHGADAVQKALSDRMIESVRSNLARPDLCVGYAAAHFNSASNVLHASAMLATLWLTVYASTLFFFGHGHPKHFLYLPPLYYLPAWVGHFVFQKDIPAVFTYGQSIQGLINGERCAFQDLFHGGIARTPEEFVGSSILMAIMIGGLMRFGGLWPEPRPSKRIKRA